MKLKDVLYIVIISIILFLFYKECNNLIPQPDVITVTNIDTIYDTSFVNIISKPKLIYINTNNITIDTVGLSLQQLDILNAFYETRVFTDTLRNDTLYECIIIDTLQQNFITNRNFQFKSLKPSIINNTVTTIINTKKHILSVGGLLTSNDNIQLGIGLEYMQNQKHIFGLYINNNKSFTLKYNRIIWQK